MAIRKVVSRSIGTDVIAAEDLAANSVTVAEIQDGAVTTAKIADGDVTSAKLDTNINVSGTLGVGGTATQGKFHVVGSGGLTGGNVQNVGAGNQIVIENNASGGSADIQMLGPTNGYNHIFFGDGDDPNVGVMYYDHNNNSIGIQTGAATRLRIDSDGLKFGSDSAAANALDDYEEGTFTPIITIEGASGSLTPSTTWWAKYTKIGRKVHITMQVQWDNIMANGGNSNGAVLFGGLPYSYASTNNGGEANLARGGYWGSNNAPGSVFSRELVFHTFYNSSGTTSGYVKYLASNTDRGGYMRVGGGPLSNASGTTLRMEIEFSYLTN